MIDGPDTNEATGQKCHAAVPANQLNPLNTTDVPSERRLPVKLTDGEVYIFDDQSSLSNALRRLLVVSTELDAEQVKTINPLDIFNQTGASESRVQDALTASIAPVVQAACDPERGVSLVITDFEMGAITGETLVNALQDALGAELPFRVILNSANAERATNSDCFRDVFMEKPFDIRIFEEHLSSFFAD